MKKIIVITIVALTALALSLFAAAGPDDFQAISRAVKENPSAVAGRPVSSFRVQVTDIRSGKVDVQITLPIAVINILDDCLGREGLRIHENGCSVDLRDLFREIKSLGPSMLIELTGREASVKVWLE